ncbi:unnamed protein product [Lepidochelys olivacea]
MACDGPVRRVLHLEMQGRGLDMKPNLPSPPAPLQLPSPSAQRRGQWFQRGRGLRPDVGHEVSQHDRLHHTVLREEGVSRGGHCGWKGSSPTTGASPLHISRLLPSRRRGSTKSILPAVVREQESIFQTPGALAAANTLPARPIQPGPC